MSINSYFKAVTREEHLEQVQAKLRENFRPNEATEAEKGNSARLRILTSNTRGIEYSIVYNENGEQIAKKVKKDILLKAARRYNADVVCTQERKGLSWVGRLPEGCRVFESTEQPLRKRAGGAAIIVLNEHWKVDTSQTHRGPDFVIIHMTNKEESAVIASIYISPTSKTAALETIKALRREIVRIRQQPEKRNTPLILAGDWNAVETENSIDVVGSQNARAHRAKHHHELIEFTRTMGLEDPIHRLQLPTGNKKHEFITHWTQGFKSGRRLDRFYVNPSAIKLVTEIVTEPVASISDHKMVLLCLGDSPERLSEKPKRLPSRSLDDNQIQNLIRQIWEQHLPQQVEVSEDAMDLDEPPPVHGLFQRLENFKKEVFERITSVWKDRKREKTSRSATHLRDFRRYRNRCIESRDTGVQEHFSRLATRELRRYEVCLIGASFEKIADRKILNIQSGGKSTKYFFHKKRGERKMMANMTIDDSDNVDSKRTSDPTVIAENITRRYTAIYSKKNINLEKLDRLIQGINIKLSETDRATMAAPISAEEVQETIINLPTDKSPGPDGIPDRVYQIVGNPAAVALAKIFNKITSKGRVPPSYKEANVTLLPKVEDPFHSGLLRPISLSASDYKIMTRIWAKRLDTVLKKNIGQHQKGFISGRDGRENILSVQMLIESLDQKGSQGAMLFLDIAKAFDSVSHQALLRLLKAMKFPGRFISLIEAIYSNDGENPNRVRFIINGGLTEEHVNVESGTRQGCPLSPLLYILLAELFNQSVLSDPEFQGHAVLHESKRISAYADDTAIHIGSVRDIEIVDVKIKDFEEATGLKVNKHKSKFIPMGEWKGAPPKSQYQIVETTRYLGVPVGTNRNLDEFWEKIKLSVRTEMSAWKYKPSSVYDRSLIIKTMVLSKIWYYASVLPVKTEWLVSIEKECLEYLWGAVVTKEGPAKRTLHKVSIAQLRKDKKDLGIDFWNIPAKVRALKSRWVIQILRNEQSKDLRMVCDHILVQAMTRTRICVHPFASRIGYQSNILISETLADIQTAWSYITRRTPADLAVGENVIVLDDTDSYVYLAGEITHIANEVMTIRSLRNGALAGGEHTEQLHVSRAIRPGPAGFRGNIEQVRNDVIWLQWSMITGIFHDKKNIAIIDALLLGEEEIVIEADPREVPLFRSVHNRTLYEAQVSQDQKEKYLPATKINKWKSEHHAKPKKGMRQTLRSFASSAVKGHQFLLLNHAVPTNDRIHRRLAEGAQERQCPMCNAHRETLQHLYFECEWASQLRADTIREYNSQRGTTFRTPNSVRRVVSIHEKKGDADIMLQNQVEVTLSATISWYIWKTRCRAHFDGTAPPPTRVVTSAILLEMHWSIRAREKTLTETSKWWLKKAANSAIGSPTNERALTRYESCINATRPLRRFLFSGQRYQHFPLAIAPGPPPLAEDDVAEHLLDPIDQPESRNEHALPWTETAMEFATQMHHLRESIPRDPQRQWVEGGTHNR